ncbi:MAG: hypothetical protein IKT40_03450 [Bacilli bacterium]|nr:hypothetical protein [Bacilli bacterium]
MTTKQKIIISLFIIIGLAMAFLGGVAATVMFNNNSIFGAILVTIIICVPSFILILGTIGEAMFFIEENKRWRRR